MSNDLHTIYTADAVDPENVLTQYVPDDKVVKMQTSADGAHFNTTRMKSRYRYMYMVNQTINRVTVYDILCISKNS